MTILDKILSYKHQEVSAKKEALPVSLLEQSKYFNRPVQSMSSALRKSDHGIIAEHKRRSPSKSVINDSVSLQKVVLGYEKAGVSAISVLTDTAYFGGSLDDLLLARQLVSKPLLRKEFIVDAYQIFEARAYGADAILLIASAMEETKLKELCGVAKELQMEVLLEVHNRNELERSLGVPADMMGVNNRNLKTFEVSTAVSKELAAFIPDNFVKVSESGLSSPEAVSELKEYGYQGYLMGEHFMKNDDPGKAVTQFIQKL
ncbi:MAG: indole-3-glycerol phosphate synthase TrpC [Bacteroidia bacterium]|nr:indole-3-glycerol phosphate synthase TrpC [Bacteroidia bacterium]NNF30218.1 indole-3-glycerol phosphate synthase TrpC [Flavobacteriaceae bacterium]MBT8274521.1 indole-3-glycerol phosphate synthase TrpC [Bacteroidia bacterium]NNJ80614.1 indole-3-glycerol phosphate synthase TrpC [Flavobacteriaceae bacterium]NNK54697.1 indole-3-glycerol phosphate synthase TrpC [Flavobacteriaceae bacterium]